MSCPSRQLAQQGVLWLTVGSWGEGKCSTEFSAEDSALWFSSWCVRWLAHAPEFAPRYALLVATIGQVWTYSAQVKRIGWPL